MKNTLKKTSYKFFLGFAAALALVAVHTAQAAPTVTTNAASAITASSATLNGTLTSPTGALSVTFDASAGSVGSSAWGAVSGTSQLYSAPLSGLTCNTTYTYDARAVISSTVTVTGSTVSFTTAACPPPVPCVTATPNAVHGFGWSTGIGWVSFNCTDVAGSPDYKVLVNATTGAFSGYAWSSNVGWISFNAADVSTCGAAPVLNLSTNAVTGWARIISGTTASGADGCINLGSTGHGDGLVYTSGAPVTVGSAVLPGSQLAGFTWGNLTTGWLSFDYSTVDLPSSGTVNFNARYSGTLYSPSAPLTLPSSGGTVDLVWQTSNVSTCSASASAGAPGPWSGTVPLRNPADWTTVGVNPSDVMTNTSYPLAFPANTTSSTAYYTYTLGCTPSSGTGTLAPVITITVPPSYTAAVDLKVDGIDGPMTMASSAGGPATLTWTSSSVVSCTSSSIPGESDWASNEPTSSTGTLISVPANMSTTTVASHTYTINCLGGSGTTVTDFVIVNVPPVAPLSCATYVGTPGTTDYTLNPTASTMAGQAVTIGVTWSDGVFHPTGFYLNDTTIPYVITDPYGLSSSSLFDEYTDTLPLTVTFSGPTPAASTDLPVKAYPESGAAECAPAVIHVVPTASTTGTTGTRRPPWQEF